MIKLIHNNPIDFEILKVIYQNQQDLEAAWPGAKYPLCVQQWENCSKESLNFASLLFKKQSQYVGHLVLKSNPQAELYICFLIISESFRGHGLIYQMLEMTEDFARKNYTYDKLWLHVNPENLPAYKAYQKYGFQITSKNESGSLKMVKDLETLE